MFRAWHFKWTTLPQNVTEPYKPLGRWRKWDRRDSNPEPSHYEWPALTVELQSRRPHEWRGFRQTSITGGFPASPVGHVPRGDDFAHLSKGRKGERIRRIHPSLPYLYAKSLALDKLLHNVPHNTGRTPSGCSSERTTQRRMKHSFPVSFTQTPHPFQRRLARAGADAQSQALRVSTPKRTRRNSSKHDSV